MAVFIKNLPVLATSRIALTSLGICDLQMSWSDKSTIKDLLPFLFSLPLEPFEGDEGHTPNATAFIISNNLCCSSLNQISYLALQASILVSLPALPGTLLI